MKKMLRAITLSVSLFVSATPVWSQNIEHAVEKSIEQAKATFLEGNREEALLKLLTLPGKQDPRVLSVIQNMSGQFLSSENAKFYFQGVQLIGDRKWLEAKERLEQAISKEPNNVLLLLRLSQIQIELNQPNKAEELLKEALKWNPYSASSRLMMARTLQKKGDLKEAYRWYDSQRALLAKDPFLFYNFLVLLKESGKISEILDYVDLAIQKNEAWVPNWIEVYRATPLSSSKLARLKQQAADARSRIKEVEIAIKKAEKQNDYLWLAPLPSKGLEAELNEILEGNLVQVRGRVSSGKAAPLKPPHQD